MSINFLQKPPFKAVHKAVSPERTPLSRISYDDLGIPPASAIKTEKLYESPYRHPENFSANA